ncbi:hypothetical protein J2X73_002753 [Novosphingobium sp. 1748]|uniref:hypothetical protein n=1 Tax=Novosphingobium sp. 1748 TaxID=2817760 RepID=UPI002855F8CB|nr:hypothetical protein [Novosphingobium sp. 1748]MDR6708374.1 hypothetical protein [Novosphingobium sp. 1748]
MAMFNFMMAGCGIPQALEVRLENLLALGDQILAEPFVAAETPPDEYGQVRRVLVRTSRILMVSEAD